MTRIERTIVKYLIDKKKREARTMIRGNPKRRPTEIMETEGKGWMPVFSVIPATGRRVPPHLGLDDYERSGL